MLHNDIIRLILLESDLRIVYIFLTTTRLQLSDAWWNSYLLKRIPSDCHFLLDNVSDMKAFMKTEGIHILRRTDRCDASYFNREAAFHQMGLITLFRGPGYIVIKLFEAEFDQKPYKQISIMSYPPDRSKCMVYMDEMSYIPAHGPYSATLEKWLISLDKLPFLIHNLLLFGGNAYFKKPMDSIDDILIRRDNNIINL